MVLIAAGLFILGLIFGSFVNALAWRLHSNKKGLSITKGRSMCSKCGHRLAWNDLIPLVSWLALGGKCRYCNQPIEDSPLVELTLGFVFAASYFFWPHNLDNGQLLLLVTWLASSVGLMALAIYDLRWFILPNKIIYPTLAAAAAGRAGYILLYEDNKLHALGLWLGAVVISSGIFWLLFTVSQGKWIGYGDVRLGLITGTLLAKPVPSLAMIFIASLIGSLVVLPGLAKGNKNLGSKLPYGPFLIGATAIVVLFGDSMTSWYQNLIL